MSLYEKESKEPVSLIGAGIGLLYPALAEVPLSDHDLESLEAEPGSEGVETASTEAPLTIAEAKRRLAQSLGVPESAITITICS